MTNLTISQLTKLTTAIDGIGRGGIATKAKAVERLRRTLAEAIGESADLVIERAMICETFGGAEAIIEAALSAETKPAPAPVAAPAAEATQPPAAAPEAAPAKAKRAPRAPKPATDAPRRRTSTSALLEAAKAGTLPTPPDFSAPTHARFRNKLEGLIALAERGDIDALRAVEIKPVSSSPKALARYRDICVAAIEARSAA